MGKKLFTGAAGFLYKKACAGKLPLFSRQQVDADLLQLHPGESLQGLKKEYYVRKISLFLTILLVGGLFAAAAECSAGTEKHLTESGILRRGSPGTETVPVRLQADDGEKTYDFKLSLAARESEEEEVQEVKECPEVLTEEERISRELEAFLLTLEEESRQEENMYLPEKWEGRELRWSETKEKRGMLLLTASVTVAFVIYFLADRDLHEKLENRKKLLREEYPNLVHKLVLLVGAGMTTRGAFCRMAEEYGKKKQESGRILPAYEEIVCLCREMQSGVAEGAAYERFGRRTGLRQYIRLSGLLAQNLKRGNRALPERLREEACKAEEERLQQGKRLGEEAGTKLLAPMVMLLAVVMLLVMIPAFSNL